MAEKIIVPVGVRLSTDIEYRPDRPHPYRARVRWFDPATKRRLSLSEGKTDEDEAQEWLQDIIEAAQAGLSPRSPPCNSPNTATRTWISPCAGWS
ncbi:hypothetical protein ACGFZQ_12125 [Streptomyces sp. NPDC048254]|uniref:hypothetical protein n=1 Tax=Streptomyces sp. NPDC048254 TaxID=3365525 RepID=UPI00371D074A